MAKGRGGGGRRREEGSRVRAEARVRGSGGKRRWGVTRWGMRECEKGEEKIYYLAG